MDNIEEKIVFNNENTNNDPKTAVNSLIDKGINIRLNEEMSQHCTYKVGGPADYFYLVDDLENLKDVLKWAKEFAVDVTVIGLGSNLLISDKGIRGLVIAFAENFSRIGFLRALPSPDFDGLISAQENLIESADLLEIEDSDEDVYIYSEAGAPLKELSKFASNNSMTGLEYSCGIPGSVGGGVYMNAGAYGRMTADTCVQTYYLSPELELKVASGDEQEFAYRESIFHKEHGIILASIFKVNKGEQDLINSMVADLTNRRNASQPLEYPSCGSVFKRPEGYFAGKLIMDSGLKGFRVGGAEVSEKHAGFIVNVDNAKATDVLAVIKHVQETVKKDHGVDLETEVRIIGEW